MKIEKKIHDLRQNVSYLFSKHSYLQCNKVERRKENDMNKVFLSGFAIKDLNSDR